MSGAGWRTIGAVVAITGALGMAWASRAPERPYPTEQGVIRLAWSARPERLENCRRRTDEELAAIPPHMRLRVVCDGVSARYRLEVRRDGLSEIDEIVRGGGARHDRPIYVLRDLPVSPGPIRLEVRFTRIDQPRPASDTAAGGAAAGESDTVLSGARARREVEERERGRREAVAPSLALDQRITIPARGVVLVTYDPARRTLEVLEPR